MSSTRRASSAIVFAVLACILSTAGAKGATSTRHTPVTSQVTITDLGLLSGGTTSSGLAINNAPIIVVLGSVMGVAPSVILAAFTPASSPVAMLPR